MYMTNTQVIFIKYLYKNFYNAYKLKRYKINPYILLPIKYIYLDIILIWYSKNNEIIILL